MLPAAAGPISESMREVIFDLMKEKGHAVVETGIQIDDLLQADEIFLTDVIHGIRWVGAFRHKRYFNSYSQALLREIHDLHTIKKA